jgi:tRNA threonylcarbamoyladenosine biosynthesis protein TsaB
MSYIINIDTATETAHVSIAQDGKLLQALQNESQKDHGAFLQNAIQQLLKTAVLSFADIDAIAVTAGPGSYTGLRVGLASAKGLCYALNKPLLTLNTLEVLTTAAKTSPNNQPAILYCPMIDARRMEVFAALYNNTLTALLPPCAMILNDTSFLNTLEKEKIVFFGSGAPKWQQVCTHPNASFTTHLALPEAMADLAYKYFLEQRFADLAYSEPFYLKEFQNNVY